MTKGETYRKLIKMNLSPMAKEYDRQSEDLLIQKLPFDDRFQMMIDQEYAMRQKRRLDRIIKASGIPEKDANLADIYYGEHRDISRTTIERFASCSYITERKNALFMGPTGSGKSYIASALALEACKRDYTVRFAVTDDIFDDFKATEGNPALRQKVLAFYRKPQLLVIDEFLRIPITSKQANDLFRIISYRKDNKLPMLICSQYADSVWAQLIDDPVIAEALIDRIIHTKYKLYINTDGTGKSMREVFGYM